MTQDSIRQGAGANSQHVNKRSVLLPKHKDIGQEHDKKQ